MTTTGRRQRVRAYHPESGSIVHGEVTRRNTAGDVQVILDGMLEEVVLRNGVWSITDTSDHARDSVTSARRYQTCDWSCSAAWHNPVCEERRAALSVLAKRSGERREVVDASEDRGGAMTDVAERKALMLTQREADLLFQMCGRALTEPERESDPLLDFLPRRPLDRAAGAMLQMRIVELLDT